MRTVAVTVDTTNSTVGVITASNQDHSMLTSSPSTAGHQRFNNDSKKESAPKETSNTTTTINNTCLGLGVPVVQQPQ